MHIEGPLAQLAAIRCEHSHVRWFEYDGWGSYGKEAVSKNSVSYGEMIGNPVPTKNRMMISLPVKSKCASVGRLALIPIMLAALTSCQSREEKFPPAQDYCVKEKRTIPPLEKKAIILTRKYLEREYPKYIARHVRRDVGLDASEEQIKKSISRFVKEDPLCCQFVKMDHVGNQLVNREYYLDKRYVYDFEWGYMVDFFTFRNGPNVQSYYKIDGAVGEEDVKLGGASMINNCAEAKGFVRG